MRSRVLPIALVVVILVGIVMSVLFFRSRPTVESIPNQPTTLASPSVTNATVTSPSPLSAANPGKPTNTNPDLTLDANGLSRATAVIFTNKGVIRFKFYPKEAPNTVKRIIELINQGFYNGLAFHRVVPGFVIQGGDPSGNGTGGSGQKLKAEFNDRRHVEGALAMARASDPDSADSQFYIALAAQPHLDHSYTVFGLVVEGIDVVHKIEAGDKMTSVVIE